MSLNTEGNGNFIPMMESLFVIKQKGVQIATTSAVLILGPACSG